MDISQFHIERVNLQGRVAEILATDPAAHPRPGVPQQLIAEIGLALEELRVAEEDLREFTEELLGSREECEAERKRYQQLFDFCPDGYIVTSPDGIINEANVAASKMFGLKADLLKGKPIQPFIARASREAMSERMNQLAEGRRLDSWEASLQDRSGAVFTGSINAAPISDEGGGTGGIRWMIRDITRQREIAANAEAMKERLRRSEQLSVIGTLAAGLGHDVKNLLFPMRSRLDALAATDLPRDAHEEIEALRHAMKYLQQLAVNLQLLAEQPDARVGLAALTHLPSWWEHVQPLLAATLPKRVTLSIHFAHDLPPLALVPQLLTQVVVNLVNNAGRAVGDEGHISIWAEHESANSHVRLGVSDNGPGLPPEQLECVRNPQAARAVGLSTGIGLPLVHTIIESAGGKVDIDSQPGKGTTVALIVPAKQAGEEEETAATGSGPYAAISLDDPHITSSMRTLLQLWRLPAKRLPEPDDEAGECLLWIVEPGRISPARALEFLNQDSRRRLVMVGALDAGSEWESVPAIWIKPPATPRILRDVLGELVYEVMKGP